MMEHKRFTEKRKGKNVIPLRNAVCGIDMPKWSIDKESDIQSFLSGDAVERLAELEDKIEQGTMIELPRVLRYVDYQYAIEKYVVQWQENGRIRQKTFLDEKKAYNRLKELQEEQNYKNKRDTHF